MTESTVTLPVEAIEAAKSIAMWAAVALGGMGALFGVIVRWMMLRIDRSHATLESAVDSFRDATDKLAEAVGELKDEIQVLANYSRTDGSRHANDVADRVGSRP